MKQLAVLLVFAALAGGLLLGCKKGPAEGAAGTPGEVKATLKGMGCTPGEVPKVPGAMLKAGEAGKGGEAGEEE